MATEAQKKARNAYQKKNAINKTITLNKLTDADIIEFIEGKAFNTLVKELIRKEIKKA